MLECYFFAIVGGGVECIIVEEVSVDDGGSVFGDDWEHEVSVC